MWRHTSRWNHRRNGTLVLLICPQFETPAATYASVRPSSAILDAIRRLGLSLVFGVCSRTFDGLVSTRLFFVLMSSTLVAANA